MDALGGEDGMNVPNMSNLDMGSQEQEEPMDMANGVMGNEEQGFDAGVNADEESDPKKYVQQLTGKLSQELRKYNDEQENPDEDLNKYVAGMIIPQATQGLTDKGKKEIIKKIKKGVVDTDNEDSVDAEGDDMQMESINEIINNTLEDDDFTKNRREKKICNKTLPKQNPFRSNR